MPVRAGEWGGGASGNRPDHVEAGGSPSPGTKALCRIRGSRRSVPCLGESFLMGVGTALRRASDGFTALRKILPPHGPAASVENAQPFPRQVEPGPPPWPLPGPSGGYRGRNGAQVRGGARYWDRDWALRFMRLSPLRLRMIGDSPYTCSERGKM